MRDGGISRLLVAALHQGITEQLPDRLEFYENWFDSVGLRQGTIGLAALAAVLSFLRREEGESYDRVTWRAGEYAAEWTIDGLSPLRRRFTRALPHTLRARSALAIGRQLVHRTYTGSRASARLSRDTADVQIRSSIFCGVRQPVGHPLCGFYAAAFERVLTSFDLKASVQVSGCRGVGDRRCVLTVWVDPDRHGPSVVAAGASE
jgi:bacteriochlorophyll 4-vinyl reductase